MTQAKQALYAVIWASLSSWYFGYHLSELNFPVTSLTCVTPDNAPPSHLPICLGLTSFLYSLITATYTIGGLLGSLGSSWVVKHQGLNGGITSTGWANLAGAVIMAVSPHWAVLALGRFVSGLAAGVAVCLVPPFLNALVRATPGLQGKTGQIGSVHQLGIVLGLLSAQIAGYLLTGKEGDIPGHWRYVVLISGAVACVQIALASRIESLAEPPAESDEEAPLARNSGEVGSPLLPDNAAHSAARAVPNSNAAQLSLREVLSNTALRSPTILVAIIGTLQQLTGVNAVMFYSTPVLKPLLSGSAGLVGIGITTVNALMTVPGMFLVDRMGRRSLLLLSVVLTGIMSTLLAIGIDGHHRLLSALAIVSFIASFSIGLGPVPFLLISELVPPPAIPALSSLTMSLNWTSNFLIALLFLPLRDFLSDPTDPEDPSSERKGEGRIFFVFTGTCVLMGIVAWRGLGRHTSGE